MLSLVVVVLVVMLRDTLQHMLVEVVHEVL